MDVDELIQRLLTGDVRALGRSISLVEDRDPAAPAIGAAAFGRTGRAAVTGFTGPPGVGKSTLLGAVTAVLRRAGTTVGVLSVDPSSPFSEGAVLGDRVRLSGHFGDPGVYIRSMATRGALGGLSQAAMQTISLMDAAGREQILVETVGVGQSEIDVSSVVDTVVLVLMPGTGDAVQAIKAGVMEIPDVVVVNRRDHPGAETLMAEMRVVSRAARTAGWRVPVIGTESITGDGVDELVDAVARHGRHLRATGELDARRARGLRRGVEELAIGRLRDLLGQVARSVPAAETLMGDVAARRRDQVGAADALVALLLDRAGRAQAQVDTASSASS